MLLNAKLPNSTISCSIYLKLSGMMCWGMKNIRAEFRGKSTKKSWTFECTKKLWTFEC